MKKQTKSEDKKKKTLGTRVDPIKSLKKLFPNGFTASVSSDSGDGNEKTSYIFTNQLPPVKVGERNIEVEIEANQTEDERLLYYLSKKANE